MQAPSHQTGQSHHDSADRRQQRQPVQPLLVGQRCQRQQGNRQGHKGVRKIELIVAIVQPVVGSLVLLRLQEQGLLLRRLIGD